MQHVVRWGVRRRLCQMMNKTIECEFHTGGPDVFQFFAVSVDRWAKQIAFDNLTLTTETSGAIDG